MKNIIIALALILSFTSCEKDEPCNCGLIISDEVSDYSVIIRNDCSGNEKKWVLSPGDWMTAYVGSDYCITNTDSW